MEKGIIDWLANKITLIYEGISAWASEHFIKVLLTIIFGYIIYRIGSIIIRTAVRAIVRASKERAWAKKDIEKRQRTLVSIACAIWKFLATLIIVLTICEELFPSTSFSALIASLGVVGVAIGFGSQSLVKDFLSGMFIISENQYRVGDIIDINNASGKVERIGTRSTTIRDLNGNVHFIPNGIITHVVNKTMGHSDVNFDIKISCDNDISKVINLINKVGMKLASDPIWKDKALEPPHVERISDLTGNLITITITGKTLPASQWNVASVMRLRMIEEFKKEKIKIS
jgi:Small-conductance mechanosensitive channel